MNAPGPETRQVDIVQEVVTNRSTIRKEERKKKLFYRDWGEVFLNKE